MNDEKINIALFDMDGTLCDYDSVLRKGLEELKSPYEPELVENLREAPDYIKKRLDLIRSSVEWWEKLPRFQLGWDILEIAKELDYRIVILTLGSRSNPNSWTGKKNWIDINLGGEADITMTRDKSLVYGKVLVDDAPEHIEGWLKQRERGLAIMPAHNVNSGYRHPNVIRYDGSNIEQVRKAMEIAKYRDGNESVNYSSL